MEQLLKRLQQLRFTFRMRVLFTTILLVAAVCVTASGVLLFDIDVSEAQQQREDILADFEKANDPRFIFGNNLFLTLIMFVPIVGPIWGFLVLFNTGTVVALISIAEGIPPIFTYILLFFMPVFWLEFAAYALAMAESVILLLMILQRRVKRGLTNTCVIITLCTLILFVAAILEWFVINQ